MREFASRFSAFFRKKSVRYGIPFFVLMIGGSFGLREFSQLRYQFSQVTSITPEQLRKEGIEMKKRSEVTLESEYEKIKNLDVDNWKQVRGPRPWEEPQSKT